MFLPRKRPVQARSRATWDSLLEAAARVLSELGYAGLTTNHVAARAGVGIGSLYEYFPDKETIVAELARATLADMEREIALAYQRAFVRAGTRDLPALVDALFAAASRRRALLRALYLDVPFLHELPEVRRLPERMLALARLGQPNEPPAWLERDFEAGLYLLTVAVRGMVIESVVTAPEHLDERRLRASVTGLLLHVLTRAPA